MEVTAAAKAGVDSDCPKAKLEPAPKCANEEAGISGCHPPPLFSSPLIVDIFELAPMLFCRVRLPGTTPLAVCVARAGVPNIEG